MPLQQRPTPSWGVLVVSRAGEGSRPPRSAHVVEATCSSWTCSGQDLQRSPPPTGESSRGDLHSQLMREEAGPLAICNRDRHLPGLCNRYKSWCVHARKGTRRGNRVTEENSNSGSKLSSWDLTDVCRGKKVWSRPRGRLMWGGDGNNY